MGEEFNTHQEESTPPLSSKPHSIWCNQKSQARKKGEMLMVESGWSSGIMKSRHLEQNKSNNLGGFKWYYRGDFNSDQHTTTKCSSFALRTSLLSVNTSSFFLYSLATIYPNIISFLQLLWKIAIPLPWLQARLVSIPLSVSFLFTVCGAGLTSTPCCEGTHVT